ncbi:PREDICTED: uncharacterized protein LOC104804060 [Tarenaya hassleriana]|uniref:uncharacterized protein LOC104804060 n=1 Tax=Tarenaya hassleriana TaxID=28532 RepID=UPI00053C6FA5|nr:PREDICTED: uncharacterized protein LOC104804060 [Tarenaya hassleriana]
MSRAQHSPIEEQSNLCVFCTRPEQNGIRVFVNECFPFPHFSEIESQTECHLVFLPFTIHKKNNFVKNQSRSPMADKEEQEQTGPTTSYELFLRVISKRRTWVCLFLLVYATLLSSSWNSLNSILNWYGSHRDSSGFPAVYASVLLGGVFGVLSMAAALSVAVPAIVVIWISVVVSMAFAGKSKRRLVVEGRKVTREIAGFVFRVLIKEGNFVALVCAVLGYFAFFNRSSA